MPVSYTHLDVYKRQVLESSPYFNQGYSSIGREILVDEIGDMLNETK